jgi:hypothetical protein
MRKSVVGLNPSALFSSSTDNLNYGIGFDLSSPTVFNKDNKETFSDFFNASSILLSI